MIKQFGSSQFLMFLLSGGFSAAVNFVSRIVYSMWLNFSTAVILAYITGMITAFVLAKLFVFKNSKQSVRRSAAFFILVNVFAIVQMWLISTSLAYYLLPSLGVTFLVQEVAHAIGLIVPAFTSYLGHKRWSFH